MSTHSHFFSQYNITLVRHYIHHADELGSLARWEREISQLFWQLPFHDYWRGTVIKAFNVSAPETPQDLIDYDRETPGFQVAAGLDPHGKEVWISFFPTGWVPERPREHSFIDAETIEQRIQTVNHELGHQYDQYAGINDTDTYCKSELSRLFDALRPKQGHNRWEDCAEVYRAIMGADSVRGTFSDGKQYFSQKLRTLFKSSWYLNYTLKKKPVWDMSISGDFISWTQSGWWFWGSERRQLNVNNWQKQRI